MLTEYLATHPLTVHCAPQFPACRDRAAWESVAPDDREAVIAYANTWRDQPWPMLTAGMYASFVRTGSRTDCERPYFDRRRKLCAAALHVCLTGESTDLPTVEDGLILLCEETAWGISAHLGLTKEHPYPDASSAVIDLFAAQTAMILSYICQLLEDRLHPDVYARVRSEVERRVLAPFMHSNNEWWMGYVRKDLNNWTPWIVSNVMMAANVWAYDLENLYPRACLMLDRWLDCVPEDGGCDEGAGYWNMAGGSFLDCLMLLHQTTNVRLWDDGKVQRIMAYPEKAHLGGGWFANFADCDARPYLSSERLQYAGEMTGNQALARMGLEMRSTPLRELNDTPHMSRILMRLFCPPAAPEAVTIPEKDVWLPDLQVRILQKGNVTLCAKGGHNGESHNHNDVGNFIVGIRGNMRMVDAGNMVYTAKTFSDSRYELWNCRAAYHSIPLIGGCEQQPGLSFIARDVHCTPDGLTLDMAPAYPPEAAAKSCRRVMQAAADAVTITDDIVLASPKPVTWVFMLREEPRLSADAPLCRFTGTDEVFSWPEGLTPAVERIDITDRRMQGSYPGTLWRLTLTAESAPHHTAIFTYHA